MRRFRRKQSCCLLRKNKKNTVVKLCRHLTSFPLRTGVKLCKNVDSTSMMKSREYDEAKKKRWSIKEKQELHLFRSRSLACPGHSVFESVFGFGREISQF